MTDALGFETKFTPGPWQQYDGDRVFLEGDASKMICDIRGWGWLSKKGEDVAIEIQTANAKLITQAPDLYHALSKIIHLHLCEQEGLRLPKREEWLEAVEEASIVLRNVRS